MEKYLALCSFIAQLLTLCHFGHTKTEKRLVLHSELDIAQEFAKLNQKINQQALQIQNLTNAQELAKVNSKRLEEQALQIQNLTKSLSEKDREIETLKKTDADFQNHKDSGTTYVRWGRTTCPHNNTELVYHGYMASSGQTTSGGGTNFLCLSPDPQWSYYDESITSYASIKGVEYEFYAYHSDGASKFFGHNVYNDDAVCAVCYIPRSASLMIPGRTDCYSGWTKEYSGYLVSENDQAVHESEIICLDDRPEAVVGGKNDDNEGLIYFVEASCGKSLECPPYINGRELTCVVCSK